MGKITNIAQFLWLKIITGLCISLGFAWGLFLVYSFQTSSTNPSTSGVGTGTTDNKNESTHFPLFTRSVSTTYDRTQMSLEALSKKLDSLGALVDDPFPTSTTATTPMLKANIARHTGNLTKIWTRCYQNSTDPTKTFAALRSACTTWWAAGKPLLFLSSLTSGAVIEGYLATALPATAVGNWISVPGTYVAYSSLTGVNYIYTNTDTTASFRNDYHSFWSTYSIGYYSEPINPSTQYISVNLAYYTPATLNMDMWFGGVATTFTANDVEVWY